MRITFSWSVSRGVKAASLSVPEGLRVFPSPRTPPFDSTIPDLVSSFFVPMV